MSDAHSHEPAPKGGNDVYQKRVNRPYLGDYDNTIFSGAERANQGMTYVAHDGKEKIFMVSRVEGAAWEEQEKQRITEFHLNDDGSDIDHEVYSHKLSLSHQGISGIVEDGGITFICGANTGDADNASKGFSEVKWNGADTDEGDVTTYRLFGDSGSNHNLSVFNHATPCITPDGSKVILATSAEFEGGARYCFVYDRKQIKESSNTLEVEPLNNFRIEIAPYKWGNVVQDITSDGEYIYIAVGHSDPKNPNSLVVHDLTGKFYGFYRVDGAIGDYSIEELEGNTSKGKPKRMESEGLSIRKGKLLFQTTDEWEDSDGDYTQRFKVIHELTNDPENADPINRGWQSFDPPSGLHLPRIGTSLSYDKDSSFNVASYDHETGEFTDILKYSSQHQFQFYDSRSEADSDQNAVLAPHFDEGQYVSFRSDRDNESGAGFNMHTKDSNTPGRISLHFGTGDEQNQLYLDVDSTGSPRVYPREKDQISLGGPNHKFKEVYTDEGYIKSSDENDKQDINEIPDEVLDAWQEVDYCRNRDKKAVDEQGSDKAQYHIGVIAQRIIEAFDKHGLNALDYGIVEYDSWDEHPEVRDEETDEILQEEEEAGEMYSIRADECLFLESALMRREVKKLTEDK